MGPSLTSMSYHDRTNHTSRLSNLATMAPWSHWPHLLPLLGVGRAWVWPSEAPKDIPFERSSLFREAVEWSVFGTGDISILYPAWMVGMMIICLVMCALACGIYVDLYIYTVRLLMLLFRTLELPKFGKRTPSPAQIGKMIPAYFAKSIDLPKTLP